MVDFRRLMTPEQRARFDDYQEFAARQKETYRRLTTANLLSSMQYCLANMDGPYRYGPGAPVYDAAFFHAILPEIVSRLWQLQRNEIVDSEVLEDE